MKTNSGERERPPAGTARPGGEPGTLSSLQARPDGLCPLPLVVEDQQTTAVQDTAAPFGRTPSGTSPVRKAGMSSLSASSPSSPGSGLSAASPPGSSAAGASASSAAAASA